MRALVVAFVALVALVSRDGAAQTAPGHSTNVYIVVEIRPDATDPTRADAMLSRTVEVLERRLASTGASVARMGDAQIIIRGDDPEFPAAARSAVSVQGLLGFHLVREVSAEDATSGLLPPGTMLAQPHPGSDSHAEIVERRPRLTGERLRSASTEISEFTGESLLVFRLDKEGAQQFCAITCNYISQRFAVLIDHQVVTAPRINEPICGGEGQISGNFTPEEVNALAALLNAGALPAPLVIVTEGFGPYTP